MSRIPVNGLQTHVQRLPDNDSAIANKTTVVFIHGLLTDSLASYYFTLGPAFASEGIDVIMYDLRGHGRSERPATGYSLECFVSDLIDLLDVLEVKHPVHLVGNSFGGAIAFGAAAAHPNRVASVIAIEAEPPVRSWTKHMEKGLNQAKTYLPEEEIIAWIAEQEGAHTARLAKNASKMLRMTSIVEDIPSSKVIDDSLTAIQCPVLGLFGADSDLIDQVRELGPAVDNWRIVIMPNQGHSVLIERTQETHDLILDWVQELAKTPA
ncbi:MAG: alpha/beta fold hydrolase [Mycobacteriaceae bacterium]